MIFSEADIKKAVESARQMVFTGAFAKNYSVTQFNHFASMTPEEFYQKVLEFARKQR